jgi:hypothetical protein
VSLIRRDKATAPDWQSAGFGNVVEDVGAVEIAPVGAHVGGACVPFPVDVQAANDSPRTTTPKTLDRLVTDQIVGRTRPPPAIPAKSSGWTRARPIGSACPGPV